MPRPSVHMPDLQSVNWINVLVVLVLTSFATMFALANLSPVQIHFFGIASNEVAVYIPIFIAFILGILGGVMTLFFSRRKHKQEILWLRAEHQRLQHELDNLRNIPLQDDV
ncbi:MAG: LapA family protein [Mariprofundus sp.]